MNNKNKIAIYGGSFNPPLNSHFSLAEQIVNEYEDIEKVVFVPVSTKYEKKGLINDKDRYNMLKIVCEKNNLFDVSDVEIKSDRQYTTNETLRILQKEYKEKELLFVIGTDNLKIMEYWLGVEDLIENFKIIVIERDNDDMYEIINKSEFLKRNEKSFIKLEENIKSSMSSTYVRKKIISGKNIRYLTPDEVYFYIKEHNLYKNK